MTLNDSRLRSILGCLLADGALVRLIYTDEAGTSAREPVCFVAAVIVHGDKQLRTLADEIARIVSERVPPEILKKFPGGFRAAPERGFTLRRALGMQV